MFLVQILQCSRLNSDILCFDIVLEFHSVKNAYQIFVVIRNSEDIKCQVLRHFVKLLCK